MYTIVTGIIYKSMGTKLNLEWYDLQDHAHTTNTCKTCKQVLKSKKSPESQRTVTNQAQRWQWDGHRTVLLS